MNDVIGQRFGSLLVIGESHRAKRHRYVRCKCDCGKDYSVSVSNLKSRGQQSCGCLRTAVLKKRAAEKGWRDNPALSNWYAIIRRCDNPSATAYHRYGGRGITICECLRVSPHNLLFVAGDKPTSRHTIERIDTNAHYSCGFCHQCQRMGWKKNATWATRKEQAQNRCDSVKLTFNGQTKCLSEWADGAGIGRKTFAGRLKAGYDPFRPVISA